MNWLWTGILLLGLVGCSSMEMVDRSLLNSAMMDVDKQSSLRSVPMHTGLRSFTQSSGGSGCGTCAH